MSPFELRVPSFECAPFGRSLRPSEIDDTLANGLFSGVERALALRSARAFRIARLPARALVFERWQVAGLVVLILDGRVGFERIGSAGEPLMLGSIGRGGFCGEGALLPGLPRVHDADSRCIVPSTVAFASAIDVRPLLDETAHVALNVARSLHGRLAWLVDEL